MSLTSIIFKNGIPAIIESKPVIKLLGKNKSIFDMVKNAVKNTKSPIANLRLKPDISVPIRPKTLNADAPAFNIHPGNIASPLAEAELGNMAIRINMAGQKSEPAFKRMLQKLFPEYEVSTRTKGVDSIHSKLKKYTVKNDAVLKTDKDGFELTTDYIGGRIELKQLSQKEISTILNKIEINGKNLTKKEKRFIMRLLKNDKSLSKAQIKVGERYLKPVLSMLAQKQSEQAYNRVILGMMKDALNRGITSIEKLKTNNIDPELIHLLQTDKSIQPIKVTRLCNYRGPNSVPVFSDSQIRQIKRMQVATGEKFTIINCPESIDLTKCDINTLTDLERSAIKEGGYTRAQMNIELSDGTLTELQIAAGKDPFYFIEHDLVYNNSQAKNTINESIKPFIERYNCLNESERKAFIKYSQNCYMDDRIQGLVGTKRMRRNPQTLSKGFSRKSMNNLYNQDLADQKAKMKTFSPYIEEIINYVA